MTALKHENAPLIHGFVSDSHRGRVPCGSSGWGVITHEASAAVTNEWCYTSTSPYDFMACANIQGVPGLKVTTSGCNSRADAESKTSYTNGSNWQWFRSYEFLKYSK